MIYFEEELDPLQVLSLKDLSYSRINTFKTCQLKYFYSYIIKKPQVFGHAATLGNIIHKALEITLEDKKPIDAKALFESYRDSIVEYDPERAIPPSMIENGQEMLSEFVKVNPGKQNIYEKEMNFSLIINGARFNGYIDLISMGKDFVHIIDYKSGKFEVAQKHIHKDLQLGIYSLVARKLWPGKTIKAELYYLKSGKRKGHTFEDDDLDFFEVELSKLVDEIKETRHFKATGNRNNCRWCSYATDGTCGVGGYNLKKMGILD